MRIIAGEYRGRILKSPVNLKTRPTSDRLRETLFNILNPKILEDTRFLDLCAGTGAVGIEALSRGAQFAVFVDKSRRACALIEENLDLLEISEARTEVVCSSAEKFIGRSREDAWDLIFYDPPYQENYRFLIFAVGENADELLSDRGVLVVEHRVKNVLPDEIGELSRRRVLKQGETQLSFYEKS